jgi:hypothetical protein
MELIYPMFAMVVLTSVVGLMTAYIRIKSAYAGETDRQYFKLMSSEYKVSDKALKFSRNFDNLFQVPMLFYAACLTVFALNIHSQLLIIFAWLFVALRVIHTIIHVSYNYPFHRFYAFILSFFCVLSMWVTIIVIV